MKVRLPAYSLVLMVDPFVPFLLWPYMCSGEITESYKWTVVCIDGIYFVLGELTYPGSYETGLGLLAAIPRLCCKPHRPGILYRYVDSCYQTCHIARDEENGGLILAWRLQNSN